MVSDLDIVCVYIPVGIIAWSSVIICVKAMCEICEDMGKKDER